MVSSSVSLARHFARFNVLSLVNAIVGIALGAHSAGTAGWYASVLPVIILLVKLALSWVGNLYIAHLEFSHDFILSRRDYLRNKTLLAQGGQGNSGAAASGKALDPAWAALVSTSAIMSSALYGPDSSVGPPPSTVLTVDIPSSAQHNGSSQLSSPAQHQPGGAHRSALSRRSFHDTAAFVNPPSSTLSQASSPPSDVQERSFRDSSFGANARPIRQKQRTVGASGALSPQGGSTSRMASFGYHSP